MQKSLLVVCPYPRGEAPSQRFRFELFLGQLAERGVKVRIAPFWRKRSFIYLYKTGKRAAVWRVWGLFTGYLHRLVLLWRVPRYSCILIHREVTPLGLPLIAWAMRQLMGKKQRLVFDFDDAIWQTDASVTGWKTWLKQPQKTAWLCRWADRVLAGNVYLMNYAKRQGAQSTFMPTMVDTVGYHFPRPIKKEKLLTLGWTGTHSTLPYLEMIWGVLEKLAEQVCFRFVVIGNVPPTVCYPWLHFLLWQRSSEIADLQQFDIGLMPLQCGTWAKGKCGFKLLQYLALEIPAVASPIGVNTAIIQHGTNGYLCTNEADWVVHLQKLAENATLRSKMGQAGRIHVEKHYSSMRHAPSFFSACALF